jgi:hypothetical protein
MENIEGASPEQWSQLGDMASQMRDWDAAIRAYKMALRGSLGPNLEMQVCWNCALAIWFRAGFANRKDTNTTDEEWIEIMAAKALYRRMLSIYETRLTAGRAQPQSHKLYQYAKDNLIDTRRYSISRERDGTLIPRGEYVGFSLDDWFEKQRTF